MNPLGKLDWDVLLNNFSTVWGPWAQGKLPLFPPLLGALVLNAFPLEVECVEKFFKVQPTHIKVQATMKGCIPHQTYIHLLVDSGSHHGKR